METEAIKAGFYDTPYGKYPKLQILTIRALFQGTRPQIPLIDPASFPRAKREDTTPQGILL